MQSMTEMGQAAGQKTETTKTKSYQELSISVVTGWPVVCSWAFWRVYGHLESFMKY